jgi:DNA primase
MKDGSCIGFNSRLISSDKNNQKELRYRFMVNKSKFESFVYNYHRCNTVIIVEGIFDLLWLYQNGIKNVISFLTAGANLKQVVELYPYKNVIFLFDNDLNKAGDNAVRKISDTILELMPDKKLYKATLPVGKDVNESSVTEILQSLNKMKKVE